MTFFDRPKMFNADSYSILPETFNNNSVDSDWCQYNGLGSGIGSFLEGPCFDETNTLHVCDIPHGRIFKITGSDSWELLVEYDGWPNGLKFHRNGLLYIADHKLGLLQMNPKTKQIKTVLSGVRTESFKGLNDLCFDRSGRLYFTDQGQSGMQDPSGRVFRYCFDSDRLDCLLTNCPSPNGLVTSTDDRFLYVAMTRGNSVWRVPLGDDLPVTRVGIFATLAGGPICADGLAIDKENNLYVCDAGKGSIWQFNQWGEHISTIKSSTGGRMTTNLTFGPPESRNLYITESDTGRILKTSMGT